MAGLGPVPLAGLMLAELGARVVRVERKAKARGFLHVPPEFDLDRHGRDIVKVDLKDPRGTALVLDLIAAADVVIEGFRPGVMERLGLGPDVCMARNEKLVFARMTGFGQDGPLADRAGHDITYLAYSGALHAIGEKDGKPVPPLNLVADFGGGTMFLLTGLLAALVERGISGRGQVVDAAMIDGVAMLTAPFHAFLATGFWKDQRGSNLLDTGAPFYDTYETADGGHVAVGCLEPQFFAEFARLLPLDADFIASQYDVTAWGAMRAAIAARFRERTRDEWAAIFEPTEACVAPVLSLAEATRHPHNVAREVFAAKGKLTRPRPAPRFSRTPGEITGMGEAATAASLASLGIAKERVEELASAGVIG
ncbi:CoA transferase [Aliihoeflea sp. 40Bstr573]|nr:CoA transferase [Aliihoeflea sp. 40Bstr573]